MAATGSYVYREGKLVKISDRIPRLGSKDDPAKEDASVEARIAAGYRHLERKGNLRQIGPGHYSTKQLRQALHV